MTGTYCSVCGERMMSPLLAANTSEKVRCGVCRRVEPPYVRALAYGSYDGGLRELIHLLKYERVRPAANVLGRMLSDVIKELAPGFAGEVVMVPVPLHRSKQRQREFNQTELIARAAVKLLPANVVRLESSLLERRRATQSQIGLSSHQRRENLRGAFVVGRPADVKGRTILLVDDVFTTGTTVSECARVLRRAGASNVWVATVARTLKHDTAGIEWQAIVPTRIEITKTMAAAS